MIDRTLSIEEKFKQDFIAWLKKEKFTSIVEDISFRGVSIRPDIYAKRSGSEYAFELRVSNSIPETFLELLASIRITTKNKIKAYVVLDGLIKPNSKVAKLCKLYGIAIIYFWKSSFHFFNKDLTKKKSKNKDSSPPKKILKTSVIGINIFISSKQSITQRNLTKEIIMAHNRTYRVGIYPILVEDDPRYLQVDETWDCINEWMAKTNYFFGILADEPSKDTNKEFRKAIGTVYPKGKILIFLRSTASCRKNWKSLITLIKKNKIRYIPFVDDIDFGDKLRQALTHLFGIGITT